jgi:tetratricopeptide (TPR) repeat protein
MEKKDDAQAILILENFLSGFENSLEKTESVKGKVVARGGGIVFRDEEKGTVAGTTGVIIKDNVNYSTRPSAEELQKAGEKLEQTKNTALAYANLASLYEKRGDYEKALETVEKGIKLDLTDKHAIGVRGKIKGSMKNYDGAIEDLSVVIKSMPSIPHNYLERGIVYLMMNRDEDAEKDFSRYLNLMSVPAAKEKLEKRIAEAKKKREENK